MVTIEANIGKMSKQIDQLAVGPATVLFQEIDWHLKMRQSDDRLNTIFQ